MLDDISFDLDKNNYFTQSQLNELDSFLTQGDDYVDDTFLSTDTTTPEEEIEMKLELRNNAQKELERVSRPQYNIKTTISNLYTIQDDKDTKAPLSEWTNDLQLGNMITLILREDFYVTVRLLSIDFDLDNLSDIELTFSNRNRLDDSLIQLGEVIAQTNRTSKSFSLSQFGYDQASKITSPVREFINGTLNATKNAFATNDNQDILIDQWGLHGRKWLPNQNKFNDRQLWLNNNGMLLSSDGFKSAQTAIGLLTAPDGATYYGIATEVLIGEIVIGSKLRITNSSGNYTIDTNGFTASATVGSNDYSVGINPSNPANIINVKINDTKKFYIDTSTNELIFDGKLTANAINAEMINALNIVATSVKSSWVYTGVINANQITAGTISGDRINGGTITGSQIRSVFYNAGDSITLTMSDVAFGVSLDMAEGTWFNASLGHSTLRFQGSGSGGATYGRTSMNIGSGFTVNSSGHVTCNSLTVGGYSAITSYNIGSYIPTIPQYTNQLIASDTGYGNIDFQGFDNAAGVKWVQANYVPIGTSDIRLKYDIYSLDDIPDELFFSLKPKRFKYKTDIYGKGISFGLIAQEVENAFQSYGLNPYDYNLIDVKDVRTYTDDGFYVDKETHRLNYNNLISWLIHIVQKQEKRIKILEQI